MMSKFAPFVLDNISVRWCAPPDKTGDHTTSNPSSNSKGREIANAYEEEFAQTVSTEIWESGREKCRKRHASEEEGNSEVG
jgi:hypothetical protein